MAGEKFDNEKIRMDLLPFESLEEIADVLTFGAKKYSDNNWKLVEDPIRRYESAMLRHISAYKKGEMKDPESGKSHLAHAGCCLLFLIHSTALRTAKEEVCNCRYLSAHASVDSRD